jgi:ribosome-binding protein aMBF1 (putative translation factor)
MDTRKVKNKLNKDAVLDMNWLDKGIFRQENETWLNISFMIGLNVLRALREQKMTQRQLAQALNCSPQYVNKIVKGSENLTLETICKLEQALQIKLIMTTTLEPAS